MASLYYSTVKEHVDTMRRCNPEQLQQMEHACDAASDEFYHKKFICTECVHEFVVVRNGQVQLYTEDLEAARLQLNSGGGGSGMIVEFVDGDLVLDPHNVYGEPQIPPRFNKYWDGWGAIAGMQEFAERHRASIHP